MSTQNARQFFIGFSAISEGFPVELSYPMGGIFGTSQIMIFSWRPWPAADLANHLFLVATGRMGDHTTLSGSWIPSILLGLGVLTDLAEIWPVGFETSQVMIFFGGRFGRPHFIILEIGWGRRSDPGGCISFSPA